MSGKIISEKAVTLAEVKKILEQKGKEQLDPFQMRTYEYVNRFMKVDEKDFMCSGLEMMTFWLFPSAT